MKNKIFTFILALVASTMLPVKAQSLIRVDDNSIADWDNLPENYVAEAVCPEDAALLGLKSVKVFADPIYINILVEPNMDDITDLFWVPFHVYINADNSDATGGYSDEFLDANTDIMLEGAFLVDEEPSSYNPAVFKWWGEVGGSGWEWIDPSIDHDASDYWGAIIGEGQLPVGASQFVDGKCEIQLLRKLLATVHEMNENEFSIGFDIQQNWSSVGILPCASATDENPSGKAAKLHVTICKECVDPDAGEAKLWPLIIDETTSTTFGQYVAGDFRPDDTGNFLYIWNSTYVDGTASGLNAFGHDEGYMALNVGGQGWSGAGFCLTEGGSSWQDAEALRQAIVANPDDYFLHLAIKSTDNASHCFYFMGNEGTKFVLGNHVIYDGPVYQDFERDGKWHEFYIPMAQYASVLANTTLEAGVNVFVVLSEGVAGVQLNLDAVYFCTKAMKDLMPAVVNPEPIGPEEVEVAVNYLDKDAQVIDKDAVVLLLPEAPEFEGFVFLRWEVVAGNLEDGINIQAVYEADGERSVPAVVVDPSNPAQKLVREGNVYILKGTNLYTIQGQKVK